MRITAAVIAACITAAPVAAFAAASLSPGKWSSVGTVTAVDMPGMPPEALAMMKRRPMAHRYCLTQGEIERGAKGLFSEGNGECAYTRFNMAGGRLNAIMQCKGPRGDMRMTMAGRYGPSSYESTSIMVMGGPRGKMRMTVKTSGKRIGDC